MYLLGKTLILKEGSIRMSKTTTMNNDEKGCVYYISLVAADKKGFPRDEIFTFDIASKIELEDCDVQVLDCHDLGKQYEIYCEQTSKEEATVYEMVESLIRNNPDSSYFIDECPFLTQSDTFLDAGE